MDGRNCYIHVRTVRIIDLMYVANENVLRFEYEKSKSQKIKQQKIQKQTKSENKRIKNKKKFIDMQ